MTADPLAAIFAGLAARRAAIEATEDPAELVREAHEAARVVTEANRLRADCLERLAGIRREGRES